MKGGKGVDLVARPLRIDAERNRQKILAAAAEVFADRGLDATLDDIAHHAGVGVGTVYRRFPDKDSLVEALFSDQIESMVASAARGLDKADATDALVEFIENMCADQARNRGLKQVLSMANVGRDRVHELRNRLSPLVGELFLKARAQGGLRPDAEQLDIPMFIFMVGNVSDASRDAEPDVWRRYLRILLDGWLVAGSPTTSTVAALKPEQFDASMRNWHKR